MTSPELEAARADVKIQAERAVQARAAGRLSLNAEVAIEGAFEELSRQQQLASGGRTDLFFPNSVSLTGVQPLYTGGQVENAIEAAETRITEQRALLTAIEQQGFSRR